MSSAAVWIPHASLDFPASKLRSFSWSSDGTLFSVTFESRVVLYDSSSVTALNTISCSAIGDSVSSHFIGSRYLLVVSKQKLLLWDLILQSGAYPESPLRNLTLIRYPPTAAWTHASESSISYVVPHPNTDTFVVFYSESGKDNQSSTTTIQVFGAGSSKPQLTQSIPLALPSAVWFGTHDDSSSSSGSYNLVALTDTSKVVVMGNDPNVAQARPSSMALGFATQKPSLFQDIFGSPLDAAGPSSATAESSNAAAAAAIIGASSNNKQDAFPFPAYLAPSLSSMFNPLVKSYLVVREEREEGGGKVDEDDEEDDMDVDEPTVVYKPATTQLAFSADQLVSFFKKQSACE